ncbi:PEP-CTERM sorting domain-containing protein [Colwellia psychrerythraea]|uniref:Lcl C-terminal domain-containing protein n=1 Tax=Colwellia psychrerythraea (strain 34H / ATCC BAA-681) TaxID=167879 RepID=Q482C7_COLP3|nr:PEP-CTERM sorting domain-containing protein [Colwellia psychrerythraea]AAZ27816.1 hypothetical protein CPS_2373 [Colwellia psychrerythraea 34H]
MKNKIMKFVQSSILLLSIIFSYQATAGLIMRDQGMVYDDVLNITWLLDANYAKTSGAIDADSSGKMTWTNANAWVDSINVGGFSDWRLATVDTVNSDKSELAHMFMVNLTNTDSLINKSFSDVNTGEKYNFSNLFGSRYWTDTSVNDTKAWSFSFSNGSENGNKLKSETFKAWAVREGDVMSFSVPEPTNIAIFIIGIMGLIHVRRISKK